MKCLYLIFLFITLALQSIAQETDFPFRKVNVSHGLSSNQVSAIYQDRQGFMWFATAYGINRYDGKKNEVFPHQLLDTSGIWNSPIDRIFEDPFGLIWFQSEEGSILFSPERETFLFPSDTIRYGNISASDVRYILPTKERGYWVVHKLGLSLFLQDENASIPILKGKDQTDKLLDLPIADIIEASNGDLFVVYINGTLDRLSAKTHRVLSRRKIPTPVPASSIENFRLVLDKEEELWIVMPGANLGIYRFSPLSNNFTRMHMDSKPLALNTNMVTGAIVQDDGSIWLATDHGGINIVDKNNGVYYLISDRENPSGLSQNSINAIYKDHDGITWIGTYKKGVNYYHKSFLKFKTYRHDPRQKNSLPYDDVNRFAEDSMGNLWIGTNGGGLIYMDRKNGSFTTYKHDPKNPNSISSDVIVSLLVDRKNQLWVGTFLGGLEQFTGKGFHHFQADTSNSGGISDINIWELFEDSSGNIWVGTLNEGLDQYNPANQKINHFDNQTPPKLPSNYIAALEEDHKGRIWIGTNEGLATWDKSTGTFRQYFHQANKDSSLSHDNIYDIHKDAKDRIWIATQQGLNYFHEPSQSFITFTQKDGLPHDAVLTILSDDRDQLWVSTPNGICRIKPPDNLIIDYSDSLEFSTYTPSDGLQGASFNENAALKTKSGELVMGGANGFNLFDPEHLPTAPDPPKVLITDLMLFNKRVYPEDEISDRKLLNKSISHSSKVVLKHFENVFSIEFSALNYLFPEKSTYRYRLLGFNKNWLTTDEPNSRVSYTNLDPGEYTFQVMAANNEGIWSPQVTELSIEVLPPFWKTLPAYLLYALLVLAGIIIWRKNIQQRERAKFQLEQEHQETVRMQELDRMKTAFFTNISHEFRTPLTLIMAPLEKLMNHARNSDDHHQYQTIHKNTKRLLNLVNQLLDFRKIEVKRMSYSPALGDIIAFIADTVHSFAEISEKKDIQLAYAPHQNELLTEFDADKVEKILFNLLSNAFKFTPEKGTITVSTHLLTSTSSGDETSTLAIEVKDTGKGIPPEYQDKIFERFYQGDEKNVMNQGSGIGLSLARDLARLHGGDIFLNSIPGKGSTFTVHLPLSRQTNLAEQGESPVPIQLPPTTNNETNSDKNLTKNSRKPVILLVEDNEDFRAYMAENLSEHYRIIQAQNGKIGWEQTLQEMPEMIISDVMMPEMNGIQLCHQAKSDIRTSHIPIILLTARSSEEQQLEGYGTGANHYVTKPFRFDLLLSRIKNLLDERKVLQTHYNKQISIQASEREIESLDEKLIHKAIVLVEKHLDQSDFTVEVMSRELGMSRVQLFKKLQYLTGKTPSTFIREIRLQHGAQLLKKSQLTVSEVAYQVGFNDVRYFTKHFKNTYKCLPSKYR